MTTYRVMCRMDCPKCNGKKRTNDTRSGKQVKCDRCNGTGKYEGWVNINNIVKKDHSHYHGQDGI